jgi:hypothetical protein
MTSGPTPDPSDMPTTARDRGDHDPVELIAAILLGLAAMAIAWSTFQSALWGGRQDEAYTESVREANNAVDLLQAADNTRALDQALFVEVATSDVCQPATRSDRCDAVLVNMSDEGAAAVESWLDSERTSSPFESGSYLDALYSEGEGAEELSQVRFDEAGEANARGDNYELAATLLTVVLFFAGISVVIHDRTIQIALLAVAGIVFVGSLGFVLTLPTA